MKSTLTTGGSSAQGAGGLFAAGAERFAGLGGPARHPTLARKPMTRAAGELAALTLDARGTILHADQASETLFKYRRSELVRQHVSLLLPQLADLDLTQNGELNPRLRFLLYIGRTFEAVAKTGERFAGEVFVNVLDNAGAGRLSLIIAVDAEADAAGPDRLGAN